MTAGDYDLAIVGGGLVGGCLACALGHTGLRTLVIEAVAPRTDRHPSYDERVIALSWTSQRILAGIGLWPRIVDGAEPIHQVHVSQAGGFGITRIRDEEEAVEALGYVVPARLLGIAIHEVLAEQANLTLLAPASLSEFQVDAESATLAVHAGEDVIRLRGRLLVAADGGNSTVRQRLGIRVREQRYGQDAVIATVTAERPHPGTAFERFTETGPLALLPLSEGRYSVVWTTLEEQTAELLGLSDEAFVERLRERFGLKLGRFLEPSRRLAYPLRLMLTPDPTGPRTALIGNAAHTLHPVAGQGFNLGLRDVAALAEVLSDSSSAGIDPGNASVLASYRDWRRADHAAVAAVTDTLARHFIHPWPPLRLARDLGLLGLGLFAGPRHLLARRLMGRYGRQTRLARGLRLEIPDE